LLCVKPQHMAEMLASVKDLVTEKHLIITIAAGISTRYIQDALNPGLKLRVVRAMPNTPMLVNKGMVGISPGAHATPADMAAATKIFQAAASVTEVREDLMNAVTAVSGSGPAYFFFLVEHMIQAGIEMGLTPQQAHQLATQTARGAAEMLCTSTDSPAELRRKVTSPGGTTHAAITTMQERGMPAIVVDALKAACKRGAELGK
jgi:pyrroline-5-carboxylate reductase